MGLGAERGVVTFRIDMVHVAFYRHSSGVILEDDLRGEEQTTRGRGPNSEATAFSRNTRSFTEIPVVWRAKRRLRQNSWGDAVRPVHCVRRGGQEGTETCATCDRMPRRGATSLYRNSERC